VDRGSTEPGSTERQGFPTTAFTGLATALSGLTVRGRSLIAAGLACLCSAVVLGEEDLMRVGVLVLALPLGATTVLAATRLRLTCTRTLTPRRVSAGSLVQVALTVENTGRSATPVLHAEDLVVPADDSSGIADHEGWASTPPLALDRLDAGDTRRMTYSLRPPRRGSYELGPLAVRVCDPFGFCELPRLFSSSDRLLVTPETVPLPRLDPVGRLAVGASTGGGAVGGTGDDDVGTRPYRLGDELRRVHWRTTARIGELSVRREEQPRPGSVTLLLDTRASAWPPGLADGAGARSGDFETAVSVVASLALALADSGSGLRLETLDGGTLAVVPGGRWSSSTEVGALLDLLATLTVGSGARPDTGPVRSPAGGVADPTSGASRSGDLRVAVLGRLAPADAELLTGTGGPGLALLIGNRAEAAVVAGLGWRCQRVADLGSLPLAWQLLASGPARAFGSRS
jgi:uncharacterized protein (DUF58 family)